MGWFIKASTVTAAGVSFLLLASPAAASTPVLDSGFDAGSGWTATSEVTFGALGAGAVFGFNPSFNSAAGTVSQGFSVSEDGVFDYAFDAGRGEAFCACQDVGLTFELRLDGAVLSSLLPQFGGSSPLSTPLATHYAGSAPLLAGDHVLSFAFSRTASGFGRAPYFVVGGVEGGFTPNAVETPIGGVGGVPEPSVWALMIAGFGLAGGALRRRRHALAS